MGQTVLREAAVPTFLLIKTCLDISDVLKDLLPNYLSFIASLLVMAAKLNKGNDQNGSL